MNILFICTQLFPCTIGGVEIFNYYLIKALGKYHDIWVITSCDTNFNQKNVHVIKINPKKLGSQKLSIFYEHSRNILTVRDKIDLIHVPYMSRSWRYGCYLPIIKKLCNLPYLVSIHGGGMHPWKPKIPHKLLFQHADAIVAVSETIKNEYEKRSGRNIKVIPPLIPFKKSKISKTKLREKYGFRKDDTIILSLGSIKKIKGSDILINGFFLLGKDYIEKNQIRLLYVGDGIMKKELKEKIKNRGFEKYAKFFGNIPYEKVPEMYRITDIFVIPSLFESFGISYLEAIFNGLPVIGSDTYVINKFIIDNKNGLLFEKNNYKDLANKIKELINKKELAKNLGEKAKKYYKKSYIFENVVKDHIKLYERIIKRT